MEFIIHPVGRYYFNDNLFESQNNVNMITPTDLTCLNFFGALSLETKQQSMIWIKLGERASKKFKQVESTSLVLLWMEKDMQQCNSCRCSRKCSIFLCKTGDRILFYLIMLIMLRNRIKPIVLFNVLFLFVSLIWY